MPDDPKPHRRTLKRFDTPGDSRFLTCSCFGRQRFLNSERTCRWLLNAMALARQAHRFQLWAYVIMPEHFHLVILPNHQDPTVGPVLSTIKQSIAKKALAWVRANAPEHLPKMAGGAPGGRVVHRFWQRGAGYDRNIFSAKHLWEKIDYIHMNPVQRGLCKQPIEWQWSSYGEMENPGSGPLALDLAGIPGRPRNRP